MNLGSFRDTIEQYFKQGLQVPHYFIFYIVLSNGQQVEQIECLPLRNRWRNKGSQEHNRAYPTNV